MSVVANIAVNVDARDAVNQLNAVDKAAAGLDGNTSKLQRAFGGLNTALAGLGLSALAKDLAGAGIDADRTSKRIASLAGANGETAKVFALAGKAAKDFGLSNLEAQKGVADLYGRLRPAGISLKNIETVFNGVNKAALAAGLGTGETSGVFLQLSQALGSGALQGDELRSIMEQMPAVGQAVAKVMGVTVGEVKKLGSEGKITTDVMIKAAAELNKLAPPPPDPFKQFNAAMEDLRVELGENLLPILTPFLQVLLQLVKAFGALPEPLQTAIVALGLVVTAILAIGAAAAFLAPVIAGFKAFAAAIGAANIAGLIAGWLPVFTGFLTWVGSTFIPGLLAFFSGPVGWTVLAVAAVVAMAIAFREPIMKFFSWLGGAIAEGVKVIWKAGEPIREFWVGVWENSKKVATSFINWIGDAWKGLGKFFATYVTDPISKGWDAVATLLPKTMEKAASFVKSVWTGLVESVKGVIRGLLTFVANAVNKAVSMVNTLIAGFNRLPVPDIPLVPYMTIPEFAKGGVVTSPTLAMVGEGGEPEYIIPQSKMAQASANYLAGGRGAGIMEGSGGSGSAPSINITTGPVMEFNGQQYVTMADMQRGMQQVAEGIYRGLRKPSTRVALSLN